MTLSDKWQLEGFAESLRAHIGKLIDSGKLGDTAIELGCAYMGYNTAINLYGQNFTTDKGLLGGVIGMLGYKLATTPGGSAASPAQIAGLGILATIGLVNIEIPALKALGLAEINLANTIAKLGSTASSIVKPVLPLPGVAT